MSVKSWLEEFYLKDLTEGFEGSWLEAVEHSLKKWKGFRKENLDKHDIPGVYRLENYTQDDSCALCCKIEGMYGYINCDACPVRNKCNSLLSPYRSFLATDNPEPMIKELEDVRERVQQEASSTSKPLRSGGI